LLNKEVTTCDNVTTDHHDWVFQGIENKDQGASS
jgi:hypothetical protein